MSKQDNNSKHTTKMKTINIKLTDEQHCMIKRIAKGDKRKVSDLIYLALSRGFEYMYDETSLHIDKVESDYTDEEKKQIAKNKKLEATRGWNDLNFKEQKERGYDYVCKVMSNYPSQKDFMPGFAESLERNVTEGLV
jgi:hypothetical protein